MILFSNDHQSVARLKDHILIFETKSGVNLKIGKWMENHDIFTDRSSKSLYITCCADEELDPRIFSPHILFTLARLQEQFSVLLEKLLC